MIREMDMKEVHIMKDFLQKDIARNYFILLGLYSGGSCFDRVYGEFEGDRLVALLFKRGSGTLQFYGPGNFNTDGFVDLIDRLDHRGLIGPGSYCDKFLDRGIFSSAREGAYISKLLSYKPEYIDRTNLKELAIDQLDEVVEIYRQVFTGFSPRELMEEKLRSKRGRGIYYSENGQILSLAQSELETRDGALIVGVATREGHRKRGLASLCMQELIRQLREENKDIYLQYDNLEAGRIYESLGFRPIDQVIHYGK